MYLKYSTGFLIASLSQAGIVTIAESLGISNLGANLTPLQLLIHITVGQILGYILLFIMRSFEVIGRANAWIIGSTIGVIAWFVLLSINSEIGKVNAPWTQGILTVLFSVIAFITFGIIATYTIKRYGYNKNMI